MDIKDFLGKENIADMLDEDTLSELSSLCMDEFEIDDANFTNRRERIEELYKLALQVAEVKNYPFEKASNVKYPMITQAAITFSSLAYPAILNNGRPVKVSIIGNDDGDEPAVAPGGGQLLDDSGKPIYKNAGSKTRRAKRVSDFMSYQVLNEIDGWEDDMDKITCIIPIVGYAYKKTYLDSLKNKIASRLVLPQYLSMNIDASNIDTASRINELLDIYPNDIKENINKGIFIDFFKEDDETSEETLLDVYQESEDDGSIERTIDTPHIFIEQHRWLDLDDDGYAEPYIVTLHKQSSQIVRIVPRYTIDSIEYDGDKIIGIEPECNYSLISFFPDPEGSPYPIGFGDLLQHLNESANTSINQLIDAGHRNIMGGGFIGDIRMKGGDLKFRPGEYKRIKSNGMDIKNNIVALNMPEPSPTLLALMEFIINAGKEMTSLGKVMGSDMPANMPAVTALASIESGMQPFKAVLKRIHRGLKSEFKKIYKLNDMYLSQEHYMNVLDDPDAIKEKDFDCKSLDIMPFSDPVQSNKAQSVIMAQVLMEFKADPLIDPVELRKRIFRLLEVSDYEDLIKIPPKQTDELLELQRQALIAQVELLLRKDKREERDSIRKDLELTLKLEKMGAEVAKTKADAIASLAKAEAEEKGNQLDLYKFTVEQLQQLKEGLNEQRRMGEVENTSGDYQVF